MFFLYIYSELKNMKYIYFILVLFSYFSFAQQPILCSEIREVLYFKDLPTVTNNNDGTITLTHEEQYITDIFSKYQIYDLYEVNTSREWYAITFNNKDLIIELSENIPSETINIVNGYFGYNNYTLAPMSSEFIEFVDGKKFNIIQSWINFSDGIESEKENVSDSYNLKIEFNYNSDDDSLILQNVGETPCGNSFSIAIKGTIDNSLNLWRINSATPNLDAETYCEIEHALYAILQISCDGYNDGSIKSIINIENNILQLSTSTPTFGFLEITFEEEVLSTKDNTFKNFTFYETTTSPYLQYTKTQNKSLFVKIISVTGETIKEKTPLKQNEITINDLSSGLYLIKVFNDNHTQSKVFKFIKQ